MDDYGRMSIAKEAAITIIDTLTVADRVAVVAFSKSATEIGGFDTLIRATNANKKRLISAVKSLSTNGPTNFYAAFKTAFDAIEKTIQSESTSGCNIAVLFMTDGQITAGSGENDVINLVNDRINEIAENFSRKTTIFTFSLGLQADHNVTKRIACNTNGIWTAVDDLTGDLVTAMSSYYKLFALGLGENGNEDFAAWVEPYEFTNPAGKLGTTVSAPVYDRSVKPPLFLGVVAIDIYMDAIERVLGEEATSSTMLQRFVQLSSARCPKIDLTECELDAFRFLGGGEEATCEACNKTDGYVGIMPEKCPFQNDLPNNLWHNTDLEGRNFRDRACCETGDTVPSESCPVTNNNNAESEKGQLLLSTIVVIGIAAAGIITLVAVVLVGWYKIRKARKQSKGVEISTSTTTQAKQDIHLDSLYDGTSVVLPPPSAPPAGHK